MFQFLKVIKYRPIICRLNSAFFLICLVACASFEYLSIPNDKIMKIENDIGMK